MMIKTRTPEGFSFDVRVFLQVLCGFPSGKHPGERFPGGFSQQRQSPRAEMPSDVRIHVPGRRLEHVGKLREQPKPRVFAAELPLRLDDLPVARVVREMPDADDADAFDPGVPRQCVGKRTELLLLVRL